MNAATTTYTLRLDAPTDTGVLEAQLRLAGLRPGMGVGPFWCDMAIAILVLKGLMGTPQGASMSYEGGIEFITEWMGAK